jgi:hypothetical protein
MKVFHQIGKVGCIGVHPVLNLPGIAIPHELTAIHSDLWHVAAHSNRAPHGKALSLPALRTEVYTVMEIGF